MPEKELGKTANILLKLAFPLGDGKWRTEEVNAEFHAGFLNRLPSNNVPQHFGPFGMNAQVFSVSSSVTKDGKTIGDIDRMTWIDGQMVDMVKRFAVGVELV